MEEIDLLLTFDSLPPSNKNEWTNLKRFVDIYNSTYGSNFSLKAIPEHEERSLPQPEVLLHDNGTEMVIERKILVWPPTFIKHRQLWHEFNKRFFNKIEEEFTDGIYAFEISSSNLPKRKREIIEFAAKASNDILENRELVYRTGGIVCVDEPIEWKFYRLSKFEREEYLDEPGIIVRLRRPFEYYSELQLVEVRPKITAAIKKLIEESVLKFHNFFDCLTVLIIEPYTNVSNLTPKMFEQIIEDVEVPSSIDQIWLASQVELDDLRLITNYRQIVTKKHPI